MKLDDLLMGADPPAEALTAYETSLQTSPRCYHSLLGAARAAEAAGRDDAAERHYRAFADLTADADAGRPEVAEVRERLAALDG